ncbi:MAG: alpha-amylase [Gammaproteobacteria bacterium]|nr:MAG: alpha-amylase [Gammaproteobacteria bacterium]
MNPPQQYAELHSRVLSHLDQVYDHLNNEQLAHRLLSAMGLEQGFLTPEPHKSHWNESDIAVITYGNSLLRDGEVPLQTLHRFLREHLSDAISIVHILPFFPYSSDDGFAVMEYTQVGDMFGEWNDIQHIATDFKLMSDLVINHCSARSRWFEQLRQGESPGKDYFINVPPETDLSQVVRPRTSPLLREVHTPEGTEHIWCTFSHDQPDLNFANPDVLLEFVNIIRLYLDFGVKIFRLDAIAFLWKEAGTSCINLPQTHEIVRLLRTLIEHHTPDAIIITETNIPARENLTYFGNANEAHMIYNFSLPPLLLHTLVSGNCHHLKTWIMSMPQAIMGTAYLNFIASHDGIGLRPAEGLLEDEEIDELISAMEDFGGYISWRALADNVNRPYEINISLFDALQGTLAHGPDQWREQRFICAHTIMLALEGIPAFYIHSLLATRNDYEKLQNTNNNRAINRHNWDVDQLLELLATDSHHTRIYRALKNLIAIRRRQPAFHPNAHQTVLHLGDAIFAFWRESHEQLENGEPRQSLFCLSNITDQRQDINVTDINLTPSGRWRDLISGLEIDSSDAEAKVQLQPYQSLWLSRFIAP